MNTLTDLIDRYIATWNETDAGRRHDLIAQTWSEGAQYLDPMLQGDGREGIDAMIAAVQERYPATGSGAPARWRATMTASASLGTLLPRRVRPW